MIKDHLAARTSLGNSLSVALQSNKHKKLKHIEVLPHASSHGGGMLGQGGEAPWLPGVSAGADPEPPLCSVAAVGPPGGYRKGQPRAPGA